MRLLFIYRLVIGLNCTLVDTYFLQIHRPNHNFKSKKANNNILRLTSFPQVQVMETFTEHTIGDQSI
jgi:hypothetical protein